MAQKGNDFLLKEGDGATSESFVTVAALTATAVAINGEAVRIPNKDDVDGWSELLAGGGEKTLTITAEGVFTGTAQQKTARTRAMNGSINNYQVDDDEETVEGAFQVTNFEHSGDVNQEQVYSITLESSGKPSVT